MRGQRELREDASSPMPMPNDLFDQGFYKELLDHMSDGVYFVDRDRKIVYWNEGAERLTGWTTPPQRRCGGTSAS